MVQDLNIPQGYGAFVVVKNAITKFMAELLMRNQHKWRAGYFERSKSGSVRGLYKPVAEM